MFSHHVGDKQGAKLRSETNQRKTNERTNERKKQLTNQLTDHISVGIPRGEIRPASEVKPYMLIEASMRLRLR